MEKTQETAQGTGGQLHPLWAKDAPLSQNKPGYLCGAQSLKVDCFICTGLAQKPAGHW